MVYDTAGKKAILYGGGLPNGTTFYNQTWAYDVPSHTWTRKALAATPPPVYNGSSTAQPTLAYNSATHKVIYHQTSNAGAPADWQYDPVADSWAILSTGGGPATEAVMAYDAANNRLVGWSLNNSSGNPNVWRGALSGTVASNRCDLNGDSTVNITDVQTSVNQVLGVCGTADLNGDMQCNIIDVQRIINASLLGTCVTSP